MPAIDFTSYNAIVAQEFLVNGTIISVLRRSGATFTIRGFEKRTTGEPLTDGIDQHQYFVRVIASQWDAAAGGVPEKGDQLTVYGRRYAIESWQHRGLADMYVLKLRG